MLAGLRRVVGDRCPIVGGSSADDDVSGCWRQLGPDGPLRDGLVVGVVFSSGRVGVAFESGYEPTGASDVVTELGPGPGESGTGSEFDGRHIRSIDGLPDAEVYNRWLGGALPVETLLDGGSILAATTMFPLAVSAERIDELTHFRLVHPGAVSSRRGLTTFASAEELRELLIAQQRELDVLRRESAYADC